MRKNKRTFEAKAGGVGSWKFVRESQRSQPLPVWRGIIQLASSLLSLPAVAAASETRDAG